MKRYTQKFLENTYMRDYRNLMHQLDILGMDFDIQERSRGIWIDIDAPKKDVEWAEDKIYTLFPNKKIGDKKLYIQAA